MNTETHRQRDESAEICRYEPSRELSVIEGEIKALEAEIVRLLGEVTA